MAGQLSLQRYLLHFSYQGTRFRGLQKTVKRPLMGPLTTEQSSAVYAADLATVQGALEWALWENAKPVNKLAVIQASSRTDTGVHALCNTAHCDLAPSYISQKYPSPRVTRTVAVPPEFHARHLVSTRSYLYRLAVMPPSLQASHSPAFHPDFLTPELHKWKEKSRTNRKWRRRVSTSIEASTGNQMSILENDRYWMFRQREDGPEFSPSLLAATLERMEGTHNFTSFVKMGGRVKFSREGGEYVATDRCGTLYFHKGT